MESGPLRADSDVRNGKEKERKGAVTCRYKEVAYADTWEMKREWKVFAENRCSDLSCQY